MNDMGSKSHPCRTIHPFTYKGEQHMLDNIYFPITVTEKELGPTNSLRARVYLEDINRMNQAVIL